MKTRHAAPGVLILAALIVSACESPPDAPPVPSSLQVGSGNGQLGVPGFLLADPIIVSLTDKTGNPIAGVTITFTLDDPTGSITASAVTDLAGTVQAVWRPGIAIGTQRVTARSTTPPAVSTIITADVRSNPVTSIGGDKQVMCATDQQQRLGCWVPPQTTKGVVPSQFSPVSASVGFTQLAMSVGAPQDQGCVLASTGRVWCFSVDTTARITGLAELAGGYPPLAQLVGTEFDYCGLTAAGEAWCWGTNTDGQVGDGTQVAKPSPVAVTTTARFVQLDVSEDHTCGVATDSTAWCWGSNAFEKSGVANTSHVLTPTQIQSPVHFSTVLADYQNDLSCGIATTGGVYCWGNIDWVSPVDLPSNSPIATAVAGTDHVIDLGEESLALLWLDRSANLTGPFFRHIVLPAASDANQVIRNILNRHLYYSFCGLDLLSDGVLCHRWDLSDANFSSLPHWSGVPRE